MTDRDREESLLLFLEMQLVDHRGLVFAPSMNAADYELAALWDRQGFIEFRRRPETELPAGGHGALRTHRVRFSTAAWRAAHRLRRQRAQRYVASIPSSNRCCSTQNNPAPPVSAVLPLAQLAELCPN